MNFPAGVPVRTRIGFSALGAFCAAALAAGCATSASGVYGAGQSAVAAASPASSAASSAASPSAASRSAGSNPAGSQAAAAPGSPGSGCAGRTTPASGGAWSAPGVPVQIPSLAAVQFVGPQQGWAAGAGRIIATSDGGATWTRQYSGPDNLIQVDFTEARHGWAVGTSGLLRTSDGGATWTQLAEPCEGRIRSVHFISAARGYAVAGGSQVRIDGGVPAPVNGGILVTTGDGGATWQPVAGAPGRAQTACFADPLDGYLGTPGEVWRTTDGGRHWSSSLREPSPAPGAGSQEPDTTVVECAGPSAAWVQFLGLGAAMSHAPYLAYATQDGQHWRAVFEESYIESAERPQVHAPEGPGSYPGPFSAISPDQAAFVGYIPPMGFGAAPLDLASAGGATLTSEGTIGGLTKPYATAFLTPAMGWVVGTDQTEPGNAGDSVIVATTDGGRTWTTQYRVS